MENDNIKKIISQLYNKYMSKLIQNYFIELLHKSYLHKRSEKAKFPPVVTSTELSALPTIPRGFPEYSQDNSAGHLAKQVDQSETQFTAQRDVPPVNLRSPEPAVYIWVFDHLINSHY